MILAIGVEFLQLFSKSHVFDSATFTLCGIASLAGAWAAASVNVGSDVLTRKTPRGTSVAMVALALAGLFQVGLALGGEVGPHALDLSIVRWMPCESLWLRPMTSALSTVTAAIVTYGTFAATAALFLRELSVRHVWLISACLTAGLAVMNEALQLLSRIGTPDATEPIVALAAVLVVRQVELGVRSLIPARP
jgi:hypothetical protein